MFEPWHILVDQDEVLAHWNQKYHRLAVEQYPHIDFPFLKANTTWDLGGRGLSEEGQEAVEVLKAWPGFYADLEPYEGAQEALHKIEEAGHHVSICTSPWVPNPTCASDKLNWLETYIGPGWGDKAIITSDKTAVRGQRLIDDRPEIKGYYTPEWTQIVFDAPYNQHVTDKPRMLNWDMWSEFIPNTKKVLIS